MKLKTKLKYMLEDAWNIVLKPVIKYSVIFAISVLVYTKLYELVLHLVAN